MINLNGLVLCGGKSLRMGEDKSQLIYQSEKAYKRIYKLIDLVCDRTFVSCRKSQSHLFDEPKIYDRIENIGPASALFSALEHQSANWFIVGCDMPHLALTSLRELKDHLVGIKNQWWLITKRLKC